MKAYPRGFQGALWWIFALVSVSGLVLIPGMLEMRLNWNVMIALPSGSRVWAAALHTLAAFATLLVLGALLPLHIRHGWRRRLNFWSGVTLVTLAATLPLTALGIDYFGDENWSAWSSVVHVVLGLGAGGMLAAHVVLARRLQAQQAANRLSMQIDALGERLGDGARHPLACPATPEPDQHHQVRVLARRR